MSGSAHHLAPQVFRQHTGQDPAPPPVYYTPPVGIGANDALALTTIVVLKVIGVSWGWSFAWGVLAWYFGNHRVHWPGSGLPILTKIDGTPLLGG
jgi:hypothetical protein